ncbi:MAG TPA: periplasmic heavy metal sensor [Bryobacteraceae bacterium]|jgi:Spy/CpxP family protein refolding chaperone|nr:periplasmic heavy metal sensor [Bryobacteraceae bacterium]
MQLKIGVLLLAVSFFAVSGGAQGPPPPGNRGGGRGPGGPGGPEHSDRGGPARIEGKWWTNPAVIRALALSKDQQRGIEDVFQQNRLKLIDLSAALEKAEATLEPMLAAEHPQDSAVLVQIDKIADARAALEKANARMLYRFRTLLSAEQWKQFQALSAGGEFGPPRDRGGPAGRDRH